MTRVLFVDDEEQVLDGLRRSLRRLRDEWDMEFVSSGSEALAVLEERPADVVITDMRMPQMDGAELLLAVHRRWPGTARFILSGYAEMESILRTVPVTHQFLAKPCDVQTIREAVDRAMKLQQTLSNRALVDWIGGVDSLPSLPATYSAILQAIRDPEVGIAAIARRIESDSAVVAKVLQLVNSSFFGLAQEVTNVQQAVGLLGVQQLRDLVLSVEVFRAADGMNDTVVRYLDDVQRHSSRIAAVARLIQPDKKERDLTFTAGLLHDVGCMVFAAREPDAYAEMITEARETGRPLYDLEVERWGVEHGAVGAALLAYWGLPYPILEAAAYHNHPRDLESSEPAPLTYVHAADALLAQRLGQGTGIDDQPLDLAYLERLHLDESIEDWLAQIEDLDDVD